MFELHFADSELLALRWQGGTLVLAFAAAQVRPLDPQLGEGLGHVRHLALHLAGARLQGDAAAALGRVADGRWRQDDRPHRHTMVVPQQTTAPVQLSLSLANGTPIDISATALQAVFSGPPDYRESLAC